MENKEFNYMSLRENKLNLLSLKNIYRLLESINFNDSIYLLHEHERFNCSMIHIKPNEILYKDDYISFERYYNFLASGNPVIDIMFIKHNKNWRLLGDNFYRPFMKRRFTRVNAFDVFNYKCDDIKCIIDKLVKDVKYLENIKPEDYDEWEKQYFNVNEYI